MSSIQSTVLGRCLVEFNYCHIQKLMNFFPSFVFSLLFYFSFQKKSSNYFITSCRIKQFFLCTINAILKNCINPSSMNFIP